jgi:hypothetical protein
VGNADLTRHVISEAGKLDRIKRRLAARLAAKAGHAFSRVRRKSDPWRFSVIADGDSALLLTLDDQVEVTFDFGLERVGIIGLALFAFDDALARSRADGINRFFTT